MARSRQPAPQPALLDITGVVLLVVGTILFLALVSYVPRDVPGWWPFSTVSVAKLAKTSNYLGTLGAMAASTLYGLFGAAAFLLVALVFTNGALRLLAPGHPLTRRFLWLGVLVLAAAGLAEVLDWRLIGATQMKLVSGEGGWFGEMLGGKILRSLVGWIGAVLVLVAFYLLSLIHLTGLEVSFVADRASRVSGGWLEKIRAGIFGPPGEDEVEIEQEDHPLLSRRARRIGEVEPERLARESSEEKPARSRKPKADAEPGPASEDETLVIRAERPVEAKKSATPADEPADETPAPTKAEATDLFQETPAEPARPAPQIIDSNILPSSPIPRKKEKKDKAMPSLSDVDCAGYQLPGVDLLDPLDPSSRVAADPAELIGLQQTIIETLEQFGISVQAGDITRGPTITRYEVYPAKGVRVDRIVALERDIARATCAERINILAPIPGKDTVGIEIANSKKTKITLRELLEADEFANTKCKLPLALGKDVYGKPIIADLAVMPHCLVAGTTGSGKSVCINAIIASLIYRYTPEDLRFIMIDPKVVEMQVYNQLPHLVVPVVTDPKKVLLALRWLINEMEKRYKLFARCGVRNITAFNGRPKLKTQAELDAEKAADLFQLAEANAARAAEAEAAAPVIEQEISPHDEAARLQAEALAAMEAQVGEDGEIVPPEGDLEDDSLEDASLEEKIEAQAKITVPRDIEPPLPEHMPYIVVIIDELADLMQTAPADVESAIARITQMARAAGIHMIVATQTPRADVVTGVIKANIPTRIAFQVASKLDSRIILDEAGAEKLLGQGDMLYVPPGTSKMVRSQGVLVTDEEIKRIVEYTASQGAPGFDAAISDKIGSGGGFGGDEEDEEVSEEDEELVEKCLEVMRQEKKASTSLFQRRLRLGYTRAARILDILEDRGYVGPGEGAKPREILVDLDRM